MQNFIFVSAILLHLYNENEWGLKNFQTWSLLQYLFSLHPQIPQIAFIPQFDQSVFEGIYSLVPSCTLAMWTIKKGKMSLPSRRYSIEINNIADILNYWAWMGASGCDRLLGKGLERFVAMSAKHLCLALSLAGLTPLILRTRLKMVLVQHFEMPCAACARLGHQARFLCCHQ